MNLCGAHHSVVQVIDQDAELSIIIREWDITNVRCELDEFHRTRAIDSLIITHQVHLSIVFRQVDISSQCAIINIPHAHPLMCSTPHDLSELAEYLGLTGIDGDLFYESYYGIDNNTYEEELAWEEHEDSR